MPRRALTALLAVAIAATAFVLPGHPAQAVAADAPDTSAWVTNGDVHTVVHANGRTYLGGLFDQVGPNTGYGVPLDGATGVLPANFPSKVNGPVYAAVSDGAGGWYIGGNFTRVGPVSRHNAAHVRADGQIGGWNPNTDFSVHAILVDDANDRVYIGGEFSALRDHRVAGLAATRKANGDLDATAPLPSIKPGLDALGNRLAVKALALSPDRSRLFVGGTFGAVCGVWTPAGCSNELTRSGLAAVHLGATAAWDAGWTPQPDGPVAALQFAIGRLFVGGAFNNIGGMARVGFAALDPGSGALDSAWRVQADGPVDSMLVVDNGASLYVGGSFSKVGYLTTGTTMAWYAMANLAKLVLTVPGGIGDVNTQFRPSPDGAVLALASSPDGSRLYAGGSFGAINGSGPRFLAALDPSTGAVDPNFNARVAAVVHAVAAHGTTAYAGGDFSSVGGMIRRNVAVLASDGRLDSGFRADTDGEVNALVVNGNSLYIGGTFKNRHIPESGRRRRGVMKVDATTGETDLNFKANIDSTVMSLALSGSHLYIGGNFSEVNGEARSRGASVNAVTGAVEAWNPNTDAAIQAMVVAPDQSKLYIGGDFKEVAGQKRTRLAAVDLINGAPTGWRPAPPATIENMALSPDGSVVYIVLRGAYGVGNRAQAWSTTGDTLRWEVTGDGDFQAVAVTNSLVYIGGHFNRLTEPGGSAYAFNRQHLTAVDPATGWVQPWGPVIGGVHGVLDLDVTNEYIYVVGEFDNIGSEAIEGFARFANLGDTPPVTPPPTQPPGTTPPTAPPGGGQNDPPVNPASTKVGYWMVGSDGAVYGFGDAAYFGAATPAAGSSAVDLEPTPSGGGYWIVTDKGVVTARGDAGHFGAPAAATLVNGETVTSLSATPTGRGYWIFTSRGRVMSFGDATHFGDVSKVKLNGPVLDSIPTTTGRGYYMVASDGGIFAFGDAVFYGSMGGAKLNKPVQSLVPDGDGVGYWLVASDGGVFAFQAGFRGSLGAVKLNKPVTGMVRYADGYMMVGEDGGIFNFSTKPFLGSLGANPPLRPIVSVAALG